VGSTRVWRTVRRLRGQQARWAKVCWKEDPGQGHREQRERQQRGLLEGKKGVPGISLVILEWQSHHQDRILGTGKHSQ
jgi:hypothetical protein